MPKPQFIMPIPEIQEALAEFEGRISLLENSMPNANPEERLAIIEDELSLLKQPQLTAKQNDTINQIKVGYNHLQGKVDELIAYRKSKHYKYDK